mmetsp:Transcript_10647/g.27369  ORF Transcript_10647/g.27369 Transcript_10647/m.27369 type:complete len:295 (+) Transcript_10647:926-1810(+)
MVTMECRCVLHAVAQTPSEACGCSAGAHPTARSMPRRGLSAGGVGRVRPRPGTRPGDLTWLQWHRATTSRARVHRHRGVAPRIRHVSRRVAGGRSELPRSRRDDCGRPTAGAHWGEGPVHPCGRRCLADHPRDGGGWERPCSSCHGISRGAGHHLPAVADVARPVCGAERWVLRGGPPSRCRPRSGLLWTRLFPHPQSKICAAALWRVARLPSPLPPPRRRSRGAVVRRRHRPAARGGHRRDGGTRRGTHSAGARRLPVGQAAWGCPLCRRDAPLPQALIYPRIALLCSFNSSI